MQILYGFQESKLFAQRLQNLLTDEEYAALQFRIIDRPEGGEIIKGSGGIRKLRTSAKGDGGARVIYYFAVSKEKIFMLDIYAKNEKEDLTQFELKSLRNLVEEWLQQ